MNRQLSAAVLATFGNTDAASKRKCLQRFSARQWQRSFHWLDASGLALYFLREAKALRIEDAIPSAVLAQLEQRHADNKERTLSLLAEFVRINEAFQDADLQYVNLKGPTLVPEYCPDLSFRYQSDLDLLVDVAESHRCREVLTALGYFLMAANDHVMEFKSNIGRIPRLRDLYKAKPQHSVEVHVCDDSRFDLHHSLLARSCGVVANGSSYPALSAEDMFLSQAAHLLRHVRSEWTRVSWLLEFRNFVLGHCGDAAFWQAVRTRASEIPAAALAVGVAVAFAERAFGAFAPDELANWSLASLPMAVASWIERYGNQVLLADFPGSKLYLIVERELSDSDDMSRTIRRRLFPQRRPAPIVAARSERIGDRLIATWLQWQYSFFRLRFHIRATSQYLVENRRWKRLRTLHADPCGAADYAANGVD